VCGGVSEEAAEAIVFQKGVVMYNN
jgi:hypothetical protein